MNSPIDVLTKYWGFNSFRLNQKEIIDSVLDEKDVLGILPTGGGKTICYQIPALMQEGICIVISPLIALMSDQVNDLKNRGVKAISLSNIYYYTDLERLLDNCIYGNYKFLFLSPERLQNSLIQERIKTMQVNLIVIDEAHCISEWGNDFRPSYQKLNLLRSLFPNIAVLALTATATAEVEYDIVKFLDLKDPKIFKSSLKRENLSYEVRHTENKIEVISQLLYSSNSSIIYVRSRKMAATLSEELQRRHIKSSFFHGGITSEEKMERLKNWKVGLINCMVATTAFGMGIDKADVDLVIHFHLPDSLESYVQESGRAGRNGMPSKAIITYNNADIEFLKNQYIGSLPDINYVKLVYKKLYNYFQIAYGEGENRSFSFSFIEFCKTYNLKSLITFNTLESLDRNGILRLSKVNRNQCEIKFTCTNHQLFNYYNKNSSNELIVKSVLRTYGGIFDDLVAININLIANKSGVSSTNVTEVLKDLDNLSLIKLKLFQTDAEITFMVPREDDKTINRISTNIKSIHINKEAKIKSVLNYIENKSICRTNQLLDYFGEEIQDPCQICDVSSKNMTEDLKTDVSIEDLILDQLYLPKTSNELITSLHLNSTLVINGVRKLLEQNKILINPNNTYSKNE